MSQPRVLLLVMFSLLGGCHQPKEKEYGFLHKETTGITSYVVSEGREVPIQFAKDSTPAGRKTLSALSWRVLLPNADGRRLVVAGVLSDRKQRTPSAPNMATPEDYVEFKLTHWYLKAPFREITGEEGSLAGADAVVRERSQLDAKDFDGLGEELDLKSLVRTTN